MVDLFTSLGDVMASADIVTDNAIPVSAGAIVTALIFFIKRFIAQSDKTKDTNDADLKLIREHMNELGGKIESMLASINGDIRQINKEIGRFESSENKQWLTHDSHLREINEVKLRVSIVETKLK